MAQADNDEALRSPRVCRSGILRRRAPDMRPKRETLVQGSAEEPEVRFGKAESYGPAEQAMTASTPIRAMACSAGPCWRTCPRRFGC